MAWRVAVASIDGVLITEHFGRSRWFYIIDIQRDGTFALAERRMVTPLCEGGGHSESGMAASIEAIKDCTAVLVAVIGPSARKQLELGGISVFEEPAKLE
ncbi:MAG: dinitrogenase iron-molybdenum cofactor biosynthesis protein, partial [Treponema sp.]|nr:dinitrogenase iron-molybdenum cofactor biosynthesis protein [Treponema sp.]